MAWIVAVILVLLFSASSSAAQTSSAVIYDGTLRAGDQTVVGPPMLDSAASTFVIRNGDAQDRLVLFPLRGADLATVLRTSGGMPGLPDGTRFEVCPFASRLCAYWVLSPNEQLVLPMSVIRANAGDGFSGATFLVESPGGTLQETRARFVGAPSVVLTNAGFVGATTPTSPHEVKVGTGLNDRGLTDLKIENTHTVPYDIYVEVAAGPSPVQAPLFAAVPGARLVDCPNRTATCALFSIPPAASAKIPGAVTIPIIWTDTFVQGPIVRLTARAAGNVIPAIAELYLRASGTASQHTAGAAGRVRQAQPIDGATGAIVPLDNSGIADWDFLNPRNPPLLSGSVLGFENRTADRTFVVAVPVNMTNVGELKTEACRHVADLRCVIITVSPGTTQSVPRDAITDAQRPVVRFAVSFFNDTVPPAYASGYIRTSSAPFESPSRATWSLLGSLTGAKQPEFVKDANGQDIRITEETPYDGRRTSTFNALARLNVKPTLGERADADVDLLFRQGTLGGIDPRVASGLRADLDPISVPKYLFNIYAVHGLQFTFGKTSFLDTNLLTEAGEGFKFSYRNFGVTHILKRESAERTPTRDNDDHFVWIAQANNLLTSGLGSLRGVAFTGIYGKDQKPDADVERSYWSAEMDLFFTVPSIHVQGSASIAHSRRDPVTATARNRRAEGTVGLATATWSQVKAGVGGVPARLQRSVGVTFAQGTTDRSETEDLDEGFTGESAKFGPDLLFLSSFAARLGTPSGSNPLIPPGLSNKSYAGISYTEETFSLLEWVAAVIGVPSSDVVSRRTVVRFHRYRFRESIFDTRDAGNEISVDFAVETPRGVRTALSFARFMPSSGLNGFFKREPWRIAAFIQVQM